MKIKTADLVGRPLDYAVAKIAKPRWSDDDAIFWVDGYDGDIYSPSTNWAQGGPLIERYWKQSAEWFRGPAPLVAAMRAIVSAERGDEVDVPDELI